jgi:hypothetical protein
MRITLSVEWAKRSPDIPESTSLNIGLISPFISAANN